MNGAFKWAQRLGLATSSLFPAPPNSVVGEHIAMLDGRRASFVYSEVDKPNISPEDSRNWQWSADLSHHVIVTNDVVHVRSGRDFVSREFHRNSVELRLEEFLRFLDSARQSALPDIVSFLVDEFRSIWSEGNPVKPEDALIAFLFALTAAGEKDPGVVSDKGWRESVAASLGISGSVLQTLNPDTLLGSARAIKEHAPLGLRLLPSLVLRHAAGRLFQEAHAVLELVQLGLFGTNSITTIPTYSPAAAYFTPVPIARLLAEWAIDRLPILNDEITIGDYACGSAVFLVESVRALERHGYKGKVRLIGRDKSSQAVVMANVAVHSALADSSIPFEVDIQKADALDTEWPKADVILMNPPFRSWERMDEREREWVYEVTNRTGRPDLSIGFVQRAIDCLEPSGALATLLPAGMLASEGLSKWRNALLDKVTPSLIAVLGEHGLFQHALVNIGVLALEHNSRRTITASPSVYVAWSSANAGAASRTIRAIRRSLFEPAEPSTQADWSITRVPLRAWMERPSWLPGAGALGELLETVRDRVRTKVDEIFTVRQGIRTGANDVFIQPEDVVRKLSKREQLYFRRAVDAGSFVNGEIQSSNYLFVPDPKWRDESDVSQTVPRFFEMYLEPNKDKLRKRKRKSSDPNLWWQLTWPRSWAFDGTPRLVSKRFGLYPAFARDLNGSLAIVQANAWIPKDRLFNRTREGEVEEVLTAYWWILNSRVMVALFREYCPNVAGGQFDLEHKYVKHIPLPDLASIFREDPSLQSTAMSIRSRYVNVLPQISDRDKFAAIAYGTDVEQWNLSSLVMGE